MNRPDRMDERLAALLTELAAPRVPDYLDDMLRRTAATRQLPAWRSLERWIPMGVLTRPAPLGVPAWQPLLLLVGVLLAIAATVLIAGAQPRVPPPFGLARNGDIVVSTADGDIVLLDPTTATTRPLVSGPTDDHWPVFSPDGQLIAVRSIEDGDESLRLAGADGTPVRELVAASDGSVIEWAEWAPASDRLAVVRSVPTGRTLSIVGTDGTIRDVEIPLSVSAARWRANGSELVISGSDGTRYGYYVVREDGSGFRPILPPTGRQEDWLGGSIAPDGATWAYAVWEPEVEGRIHVVDIDTGLDRRVISAGTDGAVELDPMFSPDGRSLLIERYTVGGYRLALVPVAGSGPVLELGELRPAFTNGADAAFSPDGTHVVVRYNDDHSTWLYDLRDDGRGRRLAGPELEGGSWQRLAP